MATGGRHDRFTAPFEDGIFSAHGRLAQRESAAFTRQRSLVRNQHRPPSDFLQILRKGASVVSSSGVLVSRKITDSTVIATYAKCVARSGRRAVLQQMFDSDRQLADATARGVEHGVCNGRSGADLADLADALDAERVDDVVADLDELHLGIGRVGVDRYEVFAQARVGPAA